MATQEKIASASEMPPSLALFRMAAGHYFSRAIALAAKLKIADALKDGPRHYSEVAQTTGTHAPSLNRMMRLLASVGVFEEQESGKFALTQIGKYLRSDVPNSMRASVMMFGGEANQDLWKELEYCVRTGEPGFRRTSPTADAFTNLARSPEIAAAFDDAMATFAPVIAVAVAAAYDLSGFGTLVDVGGGNGAIMIRLLKENPNLRGIVFDRPEAAERAKKKVAAAGLESRCETVGGDFFASVPPGGDAYVLKHVIHDWSDERAVSILKNCRRAMSATGKLLILEGIYPARIEQTDVCRGTAENDVNMLVCTGGRQRSEAEFRALYEAAGFRLTKIVPTPARVSVIEGVPA